MNLKGDNMILCDNMILAVFLRENPNCKLETKSGALIWFDTLQQKYVFKYRNHKRFKGVYLAHGMESWYKHYLQVRSDSNV